MEKKLHVGVGRSDITPEIGTILAGYLPFRASESIHDHLHLTVFAFGYGDTRAIVAAADLLLIREPQMTEVRTAMAEASGVPLDNIILNCIHTHSGPSMRNGDGYTIDPVYYENVFLAGAKKAARDAVSALRPALMGVGTTHSDVGVNRREIAPNGEILLGQDPNGTYDPTMTVISFREPDGKAIGNMIHYGAHNTASGKNTEITRDWCGVMIDRLEAESGGITAFFNGCEGDCGPRLTNGGTTGNLQYAMELGGVAAMDAVRAWRSITLWQKDADLRVLTGTVTLPRKPLMTMPEIEDRLRVIGDPDKLIGLEHVEYEWLLKRADAVREGVVLPTETVLTENLVSVGPVAFFPFPFEIFSTVTLRLRKYSPFGHTLSLSNANGSYVYFPSQDQICRGGYEVWMFSSMGLAPFADDAEQYYIHDGVELLKELYGQES